MKPLPLAVVICLLATLPLSAANWQTDYNAAVQTAKTQNRPVLVNFTGSDWCGWCIKLKKEVFDTPEFEQYAASQLVLLEVDFPERKRQSASQQRANQALQKQFGVTGYPTLYLVDADGKVLKRLGYMPGGPKAFLAELSKGMPGGSTVVAPEAPVPVAPVEPEIPEAPAVPLVQAPKMVYDKLLLKGITGSSSRPMALINNKTFSPGDSYKVQVGSETVKVSCISIASDHVMVKLEGEAEPRKLALGGK